MKRDRGWFWLSVMWAALSVWGLIDGRYEVASLRAMLAFLSFLLSMSRPNFR